MKEDITQFTFDELWSDIEQKFNWAYVHSAMKHLDWQWSISDEMKIPSIDDLKGTAKNLLSLIYEDKNGTMNSGGFCAYYDKGNLELSFTLEAYSTDDFTNENMI